MSLIEVGALGLWAPTLTSPELWAAFREGVEPVKGEFLGRKEADRGQQATVLVAGGRRASVPKMGGLLEAPQHLL